MPKLSAPWEGGQAGSGKVLSRRPRHRGRFRAATFAGAALLALPFGLAGAAGAVDGAAGISDLSAGDHAAARLLAAGPGQVAGGDGRRRAGVEIRLDPGYITYWRNPGDAGVPPSFDTTGSDNISAVAVHYPAPQKLDEAGVTAFGYAGTITFPFDVTLADKARPATLVLALDYAACAKLCLPAKARLKLALPHEATPEASAILDAAMAQVPRQVALGTPGALSVDAVALAEGGATAALEVAAHAAPGATLFVEAPEGWYLQAGPAAPAAPGRVAFPVTVLQQPDQGKLDGLGLVFTLVDPSGAIEVAAHMDGAAAKP